MEAFSLLKYWKGGGSVPGNGGSSGGGDPGFCSRATTTINIAAVANKLSETDDDADGGDDDDDHDDDDGPFFDLEFAVHEGEEGEEDREEEEEGEEDRGEEEGAEEKADGNGINTEVENDEMESCGDGTTDDGEREFNLTLSSASSNDRSDPNMALSPSDDLFFKGRLVPVESSSINVFNGSEINSKTQFPNALLKSATKFRIFMLKFKKLKMPPSPAAEKTSDPKQKQEEKEEESNKHGNKFFAVKFKVEEVPIVSLFTRDNSKNSNKSQKQSAAEESAAACVASNAISSSEEKRFSKDVMHKYLKKVKPLYIRVSKRYGEKLRFSGQLSSATPKIAQSTATQKASPPKSMATVAEKVQQETDNAVEASSTSNGKGSQKQGNLQAGLRVVCKHLGKSRSASSAVAAAPVGSVQSRRDDSLLQQQDGIQSAILHCKRSFNASRESESSLLSRSASNSSYEKSATEHSRKSSDQEGQVFSLLKE